MPKKKKLPDDRHSALRDLADRKADELLNVCRQLGANLFPEVGQGQEFATGAQIIASLRAAGFSDTELAAFYVAVGSYTEGMAAKALHRALEGFKAGTSTKG